MKTRLLLAACLSLAVCAVAQPSIGTNAVYAGFPVVTVTNGEYEILQNIGYVVEYSEFCKDPIWAAYHMSTNGPEYHDPRPSGYFAIDKRTKARLNQKAYKSISGLYDLGHMAPNHAIDKFYGAKAQKETFKMSNVCPQAACLNEETWERLESEIADKFTEQYGDIWVIDGPIFSTNSAWINPPGMELPNAFFYVIVQVEDGKPIMLGVVMDQTVSGKHQLGEFVRPISEIEKETCLDFFPNLSASVKAAAYSENPGAHWPLDDELKPRFSCRLHRRPQTP